MEAETTEPASAPFMSTCDKCKEQFGTKKPKLLTCLHILCKSCLQTLTPFDKCHGATGEAVCTVQCPLCDQESPWQSILDGLQPGGLPGSTGLASFPGGDCGPSERGGCTACGDSAAAVSTFCVDCSDWLCEQCVNAHRRVRLTKDHIIRSDNAVPTAAGAVPAISEGAPLSMRCPRHPRETLQLFCETCDTLTCRDCQLSETHRDHRYQFVEAAASAHRTLLRSLVTKLEEKRAYVQSAQALVDTRRAEIVRKERAVANDVQEFALRIVKAINQRGKELLGQVASICNAKRHQLEQKSSEVCGLSRRLERAMQFAQHSLERADEASILHTKRTLLAQLASVLRSRCEVPNPMHVVDVRFASDLSFPHTVIGRQGAIIVDGVPFQQHVQHAQQQHQQQQQQRAANRDLTTGQQIALMARAKPTHNSTLSYPPGGQRLSHQPQQSSNVSSSNPHASIYYTSASKKHHMMQQQQQPSSSSYSHVQQQLQVEQRHLPPNRQPMISLAQLQQQSMQRMHRESANQQPGAQHYSNNSAAVPQNPIVIQPSNLGPSDVNLMHNNYVNNGRLHGQPPPAGCMNDTPNMHPGMSKMLDRGGGGAAGGGGGSSLGGRAMKSEARFDRPSCSFTEGSNHVKEERTSPDVMCMSASDLNFDAEPNSLLMCLKREMPHLAVDEVNNCLRSSSTGSRTPTPRAESSIQHATYSSRTPTPRAESTNQGPIDGSNRVPQQFSNQTKTTPPTSGVINQGKTMIGSQGTESEMDRSEDWCAVCHNGGELLCCDKCPRVFHLQCHVPMLTTEPSGYWECTLCQNEESVRLTSPDVRTDTSNLSGTTKRKAATGLTTRELKACERLLLELMCHEESPPFHVPVSKSVPNYYKVITNPMEFSTIQTKLSRDHFNHYQTVEQFLSDIKLVFDNCSIYNHAESEVGRAGRVVSQFMFTRLSAIFTYIDPHSLGHIPDTESNVPTSKRRRKSTELPLAITPPRVEVPPAEVVTISPEVDVPVVTSTEAVVVAPVVTPPIVVTPAAALSPAVVLATETVPETVDADRAAAADVMDEVEKAALDAIVKPPSDAQTAETTI